MQDVNSISLKAVHHVIIQVQKDLSLPHYQDTIRQSKTLPHYQDTIRQSKRITLIATPVMSLVDASPKALRRITLLMSDTVI